MNYSIRFYRKKKGFTQKKLAEMLEIPRCELSFIETKKVIPKTEIAEKISEILQINIGQIYTKEELDFILYKG
jgi:DNA-binding XRE family transcriptional regulator